MHNIGCLVVVLFTFYTATVFAQSSPGYASASHVLVIGIDGLSSSYFNSSSGHPNLDKLIATGASSLQARVSVPSQSKPNWAAVLASGGPEETGVDSDSWYHLKTCYNYKVANTKCLEFEACTILVPAVQILFEKDPSLYNATIAEIESLLHDLCDTLKFPLKTTCNTVVNLFAADIINAFINQTATKICEEVRLCRNQLAPLNGEGNLFPTMFKVAKYANPLLQTACYTDNDIIVELLEKRLIDYFGYYEADSGGAARVLSSLVEEKQPEVVFIHLNNIEAVGIQSGFGSPEYLQAITVIDAEIGTILQAYTNAGIIDETLVLVVSDHGGHTDGSFGYSDVQDVEVPWIMSGPQVQPGYSLTSYVRGMDIPATAMYALGIDLPAFWQGKPVIEGWAGTPVAPVTPSEQKTSTVAVVVVSGLIPSAINAATPNLEALRANGASTMEARAIMPSTTMTNVASILMGAGSEETGICSGNMGQPCQWQPPPAQASLPPTSGAGSLFPSIFSVLNSTSVPNTGISGAFYNYQNISELIISSQVSKNYQNSSDAAVSQAAADFMSNGVNFLFVQLDEVRQPGEKYGYNSSQYLSTVQQTDGYIGTIVESLQFHLPDHVLIVLSDHGGIKSDDGQTNNECMLVPWIANGPAIRFGFDITEYVCVMDTAAVSAWALGVTAPTEWVSNPVMSIYQS